MLALGLRNFFFTRVSQQHLVEAFVGDEARSDFVVVEPFFSLVAEVLSDIEIRMLGWLDDVGVDFEGKGSEIAIVDAPSAGNVFLDVFAEGAYDEVEL